MGRNIFLVIGVIVGVCVAAPIVISYAAAWWWFSTPLIIVYSFLLWRWGLAWTDLDDVSVPGKILGVAGLLVWSFIGVALAVYLAILAAQNWPLIILAALVVAGFSLWGWLALRRDEAKKRAAAKSDQPATTLGEPPEPDDLVR